MYCNAHPYLHSYGIHYIVSCQITTTATCTPQQTSSTIQMRGETKVQQSEPSSKEHLCLRIVTACLRPANSQTTGRHGRHIRDPSQLWNSVAHKKNILQLKNASTRPSICPAVQRTNNMNESSAPATYTYLCGPSKKSESSS